MPELDTLFKRRRVRFERLVPFGFVKTKAGYAYSTDLLDGQFKMVVTVDKEGQPAAEVVDALSQECYVLHKVPDAVGAFVGQVRAEYKRVLASIAEACFEADVFKGDMTRQVIRYVQETYQDELEFLWEKFPDNAIFRRKDNAKWYAALLTVKRQKLGLQGEGTIEIVDLRMQPDELASTVDGKRYFPGFHMNKKHWVTICLDGTVAVKEIFQRIDTSYALAAVK